MPSSGLRRLLAPLVVASMLAVWLGVGAAVAPPPAAAILCTVVNPCYTLTVAMTGIGEAQVTGDGGINCTMTGTVVTGTCSGRFYGGALVSLTGESGGGTCMTMEVHTTCGDIDMEQFTMPKAAGATYHVAVDYQLPINVAIHKAGTGNGRVTSPKFPGIDCGSTCTAHQPGGSTVNVAETPDAGSVFVGWSGACVGTGSTCQYNTISSDLSITATFTKVAATPPPTAPPTPSPRPSPTPRPSASTKPSSSPGASASAPSGPTATPGPGTTAGPTSGATPGPAGSAASPFPSQSAAAAASEATGGSTSEASATTGESAGPADSGNPSTPTGAAADGGLPPLALIGLLGLVVLVGAGGLVVGRRTGRGSSGRS